MQEALEKTMPSSVKNIAGNIMSAPSQIRSALSRRQSAKDTIRLKEARKFKGMPDFNEDGSVTEGFKARSLADEVKERLKPKVAKSGFKEMYKKAISLPPTRTHRR